MTNRYLLSGNCIRLFAHAIHVGAYLKGFRTSVTSKTEHFVTIANAISKKKLRSMVYKTFQHIMQTIHKLDSHLC